MLIGGYSRIILDVVAKYANKSNFILLSSREFAKKAEMLNERCKAIGWDYSRLKKSFFGEALVVKSEKQMHEEIRRRLKVRRMPAKQGVQYFQKCIIGTSEQCISRIKEYSDAGAQEFMLVFPRLDTRQIRSFKENVIECL